MASKTHVIRPRKWKSPRVEAQQEKNRNSRGLIDGGCHHAHEHHVEDGVVQLQVPLDGQDEHPRHRLHRHHCHGACRRYIMGQVGVSGTWRESDPTRQFIAPKGFVKKDGGNTGTTRPVIRTARRHHPYQTSSFSHETPAICAATPKKGGEENLNGCLQTSLLDPGKKRLRTSSCPQTPEQQHCPCNTTGGRNGLRTNK